MKRVFLETLGERRKTDPSRPPMNLKKLDDLVLYLQVHAIEKSTRKNYATGAKDYAHFCRNHNLSLNPTLETLSRYIAYTSQFIASGSKYLTGARHFLKEFYPSFTEARASAMVQATIRGAKKMSWHTSAATWTASLEERQCLVTCYCQGRPSLAWKM